MEKMFEIPEGGRITIGTSDGLSLTVFQEGGQLFVRNNYKIEPFGTLLVGRDKNIPFESQSVTVVKLKSGHIL